MRSDPRCTSRAPSKCSSFPTLPKQTVDYWAIRVIVPVFVFHIFLLAWTQACGVPCSPLMLEDATLPQGEVIGIVIGAIALFSIISILPIFLVWYRRRRRAATAVASRSGNQVLPLSTSMEQVSVERWLEQQTTNSDIEQYATDTCPICLSSLSSTSNLACPKPAHLPRRQPLGEDISSTPSDGSCCGAARIDTRRDSGILVLNRCHHAFHLRCLSSWFEYRHYRCPLCQASYSPTDGCPQ